MKYSTNLERMLYEQMPSIFHFMIPDYVRMIRKSQQRQTGINFMEYLKSSGLSILWQGALAGGVWSQTIGEKYEYKESKTKKLFTKAQLKEMRETKYDDGWEMPDKWGEDLMAREKSSTLVKYAVRGVALRGVLALYVYNEMEKIRGAFDSKLRQSESDKAQLTNTMGMQSSPIGTQGSGIAGEATNYSGMMVPAYMK